MNRYKLTFYNSGGYKDHEIIETLYEFILINNSISVLDSGNIIGDEDLVEQLLNNARGWKEEYCILSFEKI